MATVHIFDNFADSNWGDVASGSAFEAGPTFVLTSGGNLTGLRWYRVSGSTTAPDLLRVWDTVTQLVVATAPSIPDSAGAGWKTVTLPTNVPLVAGRVYVVTTGYTGAQTATRYTVGTVPVPGYPLSFGSTLRRWISGTTGYPTTGDNIFMHGADIVTDPGVIITNPPSTSGDITNELADWLISTGDNTHQSDGLPWLTKQQTNAIAGVVGSTAGQLDATKAVSDTIHDLLTSANHNLGTLWDLAGHLADLEIAAWQAFFHSGESRLTGPNSAGGSAFYTADGQLVSQLIAEIWQRVRVLRGDVGFGTDGWTMTATEDFDTAVAFAESADAYTLHITSYQPTQPANTSPAGLWLPRIGWWSILTGSFGADRRFVNFEQQLLEDQGRRMSGCAIQLKPGTLATVQAWELA